MKYSRTDSKLGFKISLLEFWRNSGTFHKDLLHSIYSRTRVRLTHMRKQKLLHTNRSTSYPNILPIQLVVQ